MNGIVNVLNGLSERTVCSFATGWLRVCVDQRNKFGVGNFRGNFYLLSRKEVTIR